jgi:hypothetical protein
MKNVFILFLLFLGCYQASAQCTPSVSVTVVDTNFLNVQCTGDVLIEYFYATPINGGNNPSYRWFLNGVLVDTTEVYAYTHSVFHSDSIWVEMTSDTTCANPTVVTSNIITVNLTHPSSVHTTSSAEQHCNYTTVHYYFSSVNIDSIEFHSGNSSVLFYSLGIHPVGTTLHPALDTLSFDYYYSGLNQPYFLAWQDPIFCRVLTYLTDSIWINSDVPPNQNLCMVTVDSDTRKPMIIWEKADKYATDSFFIYRSDSPDSTYLQVAALGRDSLSAWEDISAYPDSISYRYKISLRDTCGNSSDLSPFHQTILLTALGQGNFSWIPYVIENDSFAPLYGLYRDTANNGNWQLLTGIPTTLTTASDPDYTHFPNASYRVEVSLSYSCNPTRGVNTISSNILVHPNLTGISIVETLNEIKMSPNPVVDRLRISGLKAGEDISVTNLLGQSIYSSTTSRDAFDLDTQNWQAGIYLIKISSGAATKTFKVAKQ